MPAKPTCTYFAVPKPFHAADDRPEPGAPDSIEHRHDYLMEGSKTFLFTYNHFIYRWRSVGREFRVRTQTDDIRRVSIFLALEEFEAKRFTAVHSWLQRRFDTIDTFEQEGNVGYITRWQLGPARVHRS